MSESEHIVPRGTEVVTRVVVDGHAAGAVGVMDILATGKAGRITGGN